MIQQMYYKIRNTCDREIGRIECFPQLDRWLDGVSRREAAFRVVQPVLIFQKHLRAQIFMVSWSFVQKTKASGDAGDDLKRKEKGNPSLAGSVYPAGLTFNSILT